MIRVTAARRSVAVLERLDMAPKLALHPYLPGPLRQVSEIGIGVHALAWDQARWWAERADTAAQLLIREARENALWRGRR